MGLAFVAFLALIGLPIYLMWNRPTRHNGGNTGDSGYGPDGGHRGTSDSGGHGDGGSGSH